MDDLYNIPVESLQKIKSALTDEDYERIGKEAVYSVEYCKHVMGGYAKLNAKNFSIVKIARVIYDEKQEEIKKTVDLK